MSLDGTIDLPAVGPTKKLYVVVGGAAVALVAAYAYYRHAQASSSNTTDDTATTADDAYAGTGTDGSDLYTGAYGQSISGDAGSSYYDSLPSTPTTDQEWVALVQDDLSYAEPDYLVGTLGKYLARQGLTTDEAALVRSAWAVAGHPPGNQPIIMASSGSTPGTTTSTTPAAVTGIKQVRVDKGGVSLDWNAVPTAVAYRLFVGGKQSGNSVAYSNAYVDLPKPGTKYTVGVAAVNGAGKAGPTTTTTVTTKK